MNPRYRFDADRGLATINRSPAARDIPSPDEVKRWAADGTRPNTHNYEPDRCLGCGRAEQCECLDCPFCVNGMPRGTSGHPGEQRRRGREQGGPYREVDDS